MNRISSPTLLVDEQKVRANINRLAIKATANNLTLKPHFKTHQSAEIGKWFRDYDINKITVSSVKMAEYFAKHGWTDITIAFPCNILMSDEINALAKQISLSILISDTKTVELLNDKLTNAVNVYIEIDTGSKRTGIESENIADIEQVIKNINESSTLHFVGFYSHPGHSYGARSADEIQQIHQNTVRQMQGLKAHFKTNFPNLLICLGDTPCCSVGEGWDGVDEISPGNFVFYDLMQTMIGACNTSDIAVALACPVVAKYPQRKEIVVHGGAVHLSKETLKKDEVNTFGDIVSLHKDLSWGDEPVGGCYVKSISQEHGVIKCTPSFFNHINIGDIIGILPVHSCLTADTMREYKTCHDFKLLDHL